MEDHGRHGELAGKMVDLWWNSWKNGGFIMIYQCKMVEMGIFNNILL